MLIYSGEIDVHDITRTDIVTVVDFVFLPIFYDSVEGRHRDEIFRQDTDTSYEKYLHQ